MPRNENQDRNKNDDETIIQPHAPHEETVRAEWVDYNGHMNVAYYVAIFDRATDAILNHMDLGSDYTAGGTHSLFVVESHINYDREVGQGVTVRVRTQVLDVDEKRLHLFHQMHRADDDSPIASNELMLVHVDFQARCAAPIPADGIARIEAVREFQSALARPAKAGRAIGIRR